VSVAERELPVESATGRRRELGVVISARTILLVAAVVAVVAALASIKSVLLVIFVSVFSVAVLSPVASALERGLGWSRRLAATVIALVVVVVLGTWRFRPVQVEDV